MEKKPPRSADEILRDLVRTPVPSAPQPEPQAGTKAGRPLAAGEVSINAKCSLKPYEEFMLVFRPCPTGWEAVDSRRLTPMKAAEIHLAQAREAAQGGGHAPVSMRGRLSSAATYPGCPYCKHRNYFRCGSCNKFACLGSEDRADGTWSGFCPECMQWVTFTGSGLVADNIRTDPFDPERLNDQREVTGPDGKRLLSDSPPKLLPPKR